MHARSRFRRGFTLIELMTVVAIVTVLATLSITLMSYGAGRARLNSTAFDLAALMSTAQLSAMSRSATHYLIIYRDPQGQIQAVLMERPDAPPTIDWDNLDLSHVDGIPNSPYTGQEGPWNSPSLHYEIVGVGVSGINGQNPAVEMDRLKMGMGSGPDSGGVSFLDLKSTLIRRPLPAPFNNIPLDSLSVPPDPNLPTSDLLAGCSFCIESGGVPYGAIRFDPDGTVGIMTGPYRTGGVIAFMPNTQQENRFKSKLVVISAPAGAIQTF